MNSPAVRGLWTLFCIAWVIATAWLLYALTFGNYGEFDPEQRWLGVQTEVALTEVVSLDADTTPGLTLVHVRSRFCSCNPLADAHAETVPEQVTQHWVTADEVRATGFDLPATPAALIFNDGELIYAGPYASGAFCAIEDSLIDSILRGIQPLAGTYLNGLVRACRCLT